MVWDSHLFKNFPQFVVIHTVKSFDIVNEAEVDIFLKLSCFYYDPVDVGNLISGSSAFSKSRLNMWKFSVHILLKPSLENFEQYFASLVKWVQLCGSLNSHWYCLSLGLEWKQILSSPVAAAEFSKFACILSAATELSFRIWNNSARILSPPLVFFIVKLPKAPLTSQSRVSGSRWVITHGYLGHEDLFCIVLVYSCHLFLYLLLLLGLYRFCPLLCPTLHEMFPWSLIFLKRSLVFPILLFFSISLHCSLGNAFLFLSAILWNCIQTSCALRDLNHCVPITDKSLHPWVFQEVNDAYLLWMVKGPPWPHDLVFL